MRRNKLCKQTFDIHNLPHCIIKNLLSITKEEFTTYCFQSLNKHDTFFFFSMDLEWKSWITEAFELQTWLNSADNIYLLDLALSIDTTTPNFMSCAPWYPASVVSCFDWKSSQYCYNITNQEKEIMKRVCKKYTFSYFIPDTVQREMQSYITKIE